MQNSPLAPLLAETFDMPCLSLGPMDVTSIVGTRVVLNFLGFYKAILLDDLL